MENPSLVAWAVVAMGIVIGGLSWVHLKGLADVTVWFQVSDYKQLNPTQYIISEK